MRVVPLAALLHCKVPLQSPVVHFRACETPPPLDDVDIFDYDGSELLSDDGGVRKLVLREAPPEAAERPKWGALVSVLFTGRFPNGTTFDTAFESKPWEFQLNANIVVDGMERGVKSMRPGEIARLRCEPKWAYGQPGLGSRIPQNATLLYDVELLSWKEGPPIDNEDFDVDTYRLALEGKEAGSGQTDAYRWSERGDDVLV